MAPAAAVRSFGDVGVIVAFAALVTLPMILGADEASSGVEGRVLAAKPAWPTDAKGWTAWPGLFEKWFDDHFGGRPQLLWLNTRMTMDVFGVSPTSQVVLGRDGWLYFTKGGIFDDRRGEEPVGADVLERWKSAIEARSAWLAARGVAYAFVVLPNKVTIHPEHLPWHHRSRPDRPTRLDTIAQHLSRIPNSPFLDTRPLLAAAATSDRIYHATDSHWNDLGAYVAYRAILDAFRRGGVAVEPFAETAFEKVRKPRRGDLVPLIPFASLPDEEAWFLEPRDGPAARRVELPAAWSSPPPAWGIWQETVVYEAPTGRGVLLCVGDSFMWALAPLLANHFQRSVFVSTGIADTAVLQAMVDVVQPTVVLEERVERNMEWPPLPGYGSATGR